MRNAVSIFAFVYGIYYEDTNLGFSKEIHMSLTCQIQR